MLITVDCFRYDRCGFNQHSRPTTPHLDRLSRDSIVFDRAYSTGSYTTEAFPGILAGEHSFNGAYYGDSIGWKGLSEDSETLATHLQQHGFNTVATLTNPHLVTERNFNLGFNSYRNLRANSSNSSKTSDNGFQLADVMYEFRSRMRNHSTVLNPYTLPYVGYRYLQHLTDWPTIPAERVTERFLEDVNQQTLPFFAWTHLMDLHAPLSPTSIRKGGICASNRTLRHLLWDTARTGRIHEPRYNTMYDSALRYIDQCIGSIVDHLKLQGQWDDTVLIVTGDHGEVLFDRDRIYGHPRHHLYDDLLHVPLLVRTPESEGKRISVPFSLAWLHELIAEILDIPMGDFPTESGKDSIFNSMDESANPIVSDSVDEQGHTVAIRNNRTKLFSHAPVDENQIPDSCPEHDTAFDYIQDPSERVPLEGDEYPSLRDQAQNLHIDPRELSNIGGEFSNEVKQRLQDLGYRT
ncbi:sulfatase-like hydrolase/transferase [Halalkalicoccus paucihalophilus]|nr:sulfatase-like hydrolase/transferase [Halalkalicoccus paucihalophilus]